MSDKAKVLTLEEYKARSCTVQLDPINVKAYVPSPNADIPRAPNVKIDPMFRSIAMEVLIKYPEKCYLSDGKLNKDGFLAAAKLHMSSGNQQGTRSKVKAFLKRR